MSFRDEIIDEINTAKENEKRRILNNEKQKKENINRVVVQLIDIVKESFKKAEPEKEFKTNWLGMKIFTGYDVLIGWLEIREVIPKCKNYNEVMYRKQERGFETDTWYYNVIYADEEDVKIIRKKLRKWFRENDIEIDSFRKKENGGFSYRLKIYID